MERTWHWLRTLIIGGLIAMGAGHSAATSVADLTRVKGQGEFKLRGLGLVVGLPGTGDSGKYETLARPLAKLFENEGNKPVALSEMGGAKAVAVVFVTVTIPEVGGRSDDRFDVRVSAAYNASSLRGGSLYITPLRGPLPSSPVYALAEGPVEIEGDNASSGRVTRGAQLVRDVLGPTIEDSFDLIVEPPFAGNTSVNTIAMAIDAAAFPQNQLKSLDASIATIPRVAEVVDERTIRVTIPPSERPAKAAFVAAVMSAEVNVAQLDLPAMVIANPRTGVIVMTADVEISPGVVTHKDLIINTTIPAPVPTPQNPILQREMYAAVKTKARGSENAKLNDLMTALKQLDVPVPDQIDILKLLHESGRLHAKLVIK